MKMMLKFLLLNSVALLVVSCTKVSPEPLLGTWRTQDRFHQASYQLIPNGQSIDAKVLSYNDGTTRYNQQNSSKTYYLFKGLEKKGKYYVDAISGASQQEGNKPKTVSIDMISQDSLKVTHYNGKQTREEFWFRTQINESNK